MGEKMKEKISQGRFQGTSGTEVGLSTNFFRVSLTYLFLCTKSVKWKFRKKLKFKKKCEILFLKKVKIKKKWKFYNFIFSVIWELWIPTRIIFTNIESILVQLLTMSHWRRNWLNIYSPILIQISEIIFLKGKGIMNFFSWTFFLIFYELFFWSFMHFFSWTFFVYLWWTFFLDFFIELFSLSSMNFFSSTFFVYIFLIFSWTFFILWNKFRTPFCRLLFVICFV